MLDPRFRGDDKCIEHPSITDPLQKLTFFSGIVFMFSVCFRYNSMALTDFVAYTLELAVSQRRERVLHTVFL